MAFLAALARVVRELRGRPTSAFARHPTVDGGPLPPEVSLAAALAPVPDADTDTEASNAWADPPVLAVTEWGPDDVEPPDTTWAPPVDGACPDGYPVKGKLRSGIYHLPGMAAYERTVPDRCYPTAETAVADGLRAARR